MGCCQTFQKAWDSRGGKIPGATDKELSYVGQAARDVLFRKHFPNHGKSWNLSHGKIVGDIAQTPPKQCWGMDEIQPLDSHSDILPQRMYDIIVKAQWWVDITSLAPPDGKFAHHIIAALKEIAERSTGNPVTVRMLFGNIIGMPVDCDALVDLLTENFPSEANIQLWVGAWRKGVSWNHSKIIAVDGQHLFTGGHNLWDAHYLQNDPVHDISIEAEGEVANDGHVFANQMWKYIIRTETHCCLRRCIPDWRTRVGVSQWPDEADPYPPMYIPRKRRRTAAAPSMHTVPIITCGRYGALHMFPLTANPSDSVITEMLRSARTIIRLSLQDLGPLTLPMPDGILIPIPGGVWPTAYMEAIAEVIYYWNVKVQIVLSNPYSIPGSLTPLEANYGNGWTCTDVAAEIIKSIKSIDENIEDSDLRDHVNNSLEVSFLKSNKEAGGKWPDGEGLGNHAKFFIVDDICYYVGSQNLYIANLAEWGVIVDDPGETRRMLDEYWKPMWEQSYSEEDCNDDDVMDGLHIDRDGEPMHMASPEDRASAAHAQRAAANIGHAPHHYADEPEELHAAHDWDSDTEKLHEEQLAEHLANGPDKYLNMCRRSVRGPRSGY